MVMEATRNQGEWKRPDGRWEQVTRMERKQDFAQDPGEV